MAPTRTRRTSLPSNTRRSPIKTRRSSLTPARSTRGRSKSVIAITPKPSSTTKRRPPPLRHTFKSTILSDDENESGLDSPDPLNIVPRTSLLKTPRTTDTLTPTSTRRTQFEVQPERVDAGTPVALVTGERPVSRRPTSSGPRGSAVQPDNAVAGPSRPTSIPSQEELSAHGAGLADAPARPTRSVLPNNTAMPSRHAHDSIVASAEAGPSRPHKRQRAGPSGQIEHSSPQTPIDSSARGYSAAVSASAGSGKGKSPALLPPARLAPEQAIKNRPSRIRRAAGGGAEGIRDIEQMIVDWLNSYRTVSSTPPDSTIIHLTTLPLSYLDPPAQLVPVGGTAQPPLSTPSRGPAGSSDITPSPRTAEKALPSVLPEGRVRVPGWRVVRLGEDDEEDARLEMLSGSTKSPRKTRHAHLEEDDADEVYIARHRKHELLERSLWLREKEALKFERHKLRSRLESLKSMSFHTWRAILAPVLARPDADQWADGRAKVQSQGEDWLKDELVRNATKDLQRYDELLPNDGKKRKDPREGLIRTATPPIVYLADDTDEEQATFDYSGPARKVSQRRAARNGTNDYVPPREHSTGPVERPLNRRADRGMSLKLRPSRSARSEITVVAPSDDNDSLTPDAPTTRSSRALLTPSSAAIFLSPAGSSPLTPLTDPKASLQPSPLSPDQSRRAITVPHDAPPPNSTKILLPAPPIRDVSPTRASDPESLAARPLRTAVVDTSDRTNKIWPRPRNTILSSSGHIDPAKTVRDMIPSRPFHDRRQSKDLSKHPLTPVMITRAEAREMKEVEAAVVI